MMETTLEPAASIESARPFINDLAEHLERTGRAKAVFGDPIERDGITVIPVARACWGVGGGSGKRPTAQGDGQEQGTGGGGGVGVCPIGFIEIKEGQARFRHIADPMTIFAGAIGTVFVSLALRWLLR